MGLRNPWCDLESSEDGPQTQYTSAGVAHSLLRRTAELSILDVAKLETGDGSDSAADSAESLLDFFADVA